MSQNYKTKRNKELKYWQTGSLLLRPRYSKVEMLQKIKGLNKRFPKTEIWRSLLIQVLSGKVLSLRQQEAVDIAFKGLKNTEG